MPPKKMKGFKKSATKETVAEVKKLIRTEVNQMEERKQHVVRLNDDIILNSVGDPNLIVSIVPVISRGTESHEMIGNQIRLRKVEFAYNIRAPLNDPTFQDCPPCILTMVFLKLRRSYLQPSVSDLAKLKVNSSGGTTNILSDDMLTLSLPYNTEFFKVVKTLSYKLGASQTTVENTTFGTYYPTYSNNDFKYHISGKINLTKHLDKIVKYDESAIIPENGKLYCVFYLSPMDETISAYTFKHQLRGAITFNYSDA